MSALPPLDDPQALAAYVKGSLFVSLISDVLGQSFKFRVTAAVLRSVDHRGGLDAYLAKAKDDELSANALKIKKEIAKAQAAA